MMKKIKFPGKFPDWMDESDKNLLQGQWNYDPDIWRIFDNNGSFFPNVRAKLGYDFSSEENFLCECGRWFTKGYNNLKENDSPKRLCKSCLIKEAYKKGIINANFLE